MSGGGGGGGSDQWRPNPKAPKGAGKGGGGKIIPDACNIDETTNLNSVDRNVLKSIQVGSELNVTFQPGPPQRLVAMTAQRAIVGSITSPSMLQIIQCIQDGVSYKATVVMLRGPQCQVRIQPE